MKIVQLQADNFKRLRAVEISPEGNIVTIGGKNGQGKSSVLDAIFVALRGLSVAPPQPIRAGEDKCTIRLDMGEMVVTRTFTRKGTEEYTHTLKVENGDGLRYGKPQDTLNELLGEIGFDPFEFVKMKPDAQAETLLGMVPLKVDLDDLKALDDSDYAKRRDETRDLKAKVSQLEAIPKEELPQVVLDRDALVDELGDAANVNAAISADRAARENGKQWVEAQRYQVEQLRAQAKALREEADLAEATALQQQKDAAAREVEIAELPPVAEFVDTDALREQIRTADLQAAIIDRQSKRALLAAGVEAMEAKVAKYTEDLKARDKLRSDALAGARMPIKGLSFHVPETGKARVYFGGVPFEQASTAEQIRASTAIAMAANPNLRVLRIKDGSLLDEDAIAILHELAAAEDFQLFIEVVGDGGSGVIMEDGSIKVASENLPHEPEKVKPNAKAKTAKADATLL